MPTAELAWDTTARKWQFGGSSVAPVDPPPTDNYPAAVVPAGTAFVNYTDLAQPGDNFGVALARLTSPAIVNVPAGLYELVDFDPNTHYSCLATNCLGIWGAGIDKTIIQMRPGSSTQVALVPVQSTKASNPLTLMRLSKDHILSQGFTLSGTDQPIDPNTGKPHLYSGLLNYMNGGNNSGPGVGSQLFDVKITGIPGNNNSPPGETFANNLYKDTNSVLVRVEVDGFIWEWSDATTKTKGNQVGGSPNGCNNSVGPKFYGCNFHDTLVSGMTYSFSGSDTDMAVVTRNIETNDVIVANNANHSLANGQKFSGTNHENVYGSIRHNRPNITLTDLALSQWDAAHMSFNSRLGDNADIIITDPVWHGSYSHFNGCFTLSTGINYDSVPNTQTTAPTVILNGVTLTPHRFTSNPGTVQTQLDPARDYAWISG